MHILLIGGTGFLGNAVCESLRSDGHTVISTGLTQKGNRQLDLLETSKVKAMIDHARWDAILNFAGVLTPTPKNFPYVSIERETYKVNEQGPKNLAEAVAQTKWQPLMVHIASATEPDSTSPTPESQYSQSKAEGTYLFSQAVAKFELKAKIAVVHNVYGIGQDKRRFIAATIDSLQNSQPVHVKYPLRVRDFCLKSEVASAIGSLIDHEGVQSPPGIPSYSEIGTGVGVALGDAVHTIASLLEVDKSLITYSEDLNSDVHPVRIAKVDAAGLTICRTQFHDGISQVIAGKK